jgi:hypothetical protein
MQLKTLAAVALVCTMGTAAFAQIVPTTGFGKDAVGGGAGATSATVSQSVSMILPQATALHLDVTDLTFDLNLVGGKDNSIACVYGLQDTDKVDQLGDAFWSQKQSLPLGTSYNLSAQSWPNITLNGGGAVTSYPPIKLDDKGELVRGSKGYFVCYKTFFLQTFSNGYTFDLTMKRSDVLDRANAIKSIYAQANSCDTAGAGTGLYKIGATAVHMIPTNLNFGTTGSRTGGIPGEVGNAAVRSRCGYKSWLDYLVVVALPVDGEAAGTNTATLEYTLTTTAFTRPQ